MNGKIVQAYAVNVTPNLEMSEDAQRRFSEIETETADGGVAETDLTDVMEQYSDAADVFPYRSATAQSAWSRSFAGPFGSFLPCRVAPRNFQRSDERITELVAEWMAEAQVDVSKVEIFADKGIVTLRGTMSDKKGRLLADCCGR